EGGGDGIDVVDAAAPGPATRLLEKSPEPRVLRQARVRSQILTRRPARKHARAFLGAEQLPAVPDQGHAGLEAIPVHHYAHKVALEDTPDGSTCERLGSHVADAGARRDAGEARIRHHRDLLAPGQVLESGGDLVDLLHARSQRAAANEHKDVA